MVEEYHDHEVGEKVKMLRKRRGMSLRSLAAVSGVTLGAVSQIENGKSSPSISTLKKLLGAMGSSLGTFFGESRTRENEGFIIRAKEMITMDTGKGITYLTLPDNGQPRLMQLLASTYLPGADSGPGPLSHEGEECGICLEGAAEFTVDGISRNITAGDAYYFKSTLPHRFVNTGKKVARFISIGTPPTF